MVQDAVEAIVDMREYDLPYHVRFCIDCNIRCGHWFTVKALVSHSCMTSAYMVLPYTLHPLLRCHSPDHDLCKAQLSLAQVQVQHNQQTASNTSCSGCCCWPSCQSGVACRVQCSARHALSH